MSEATLSDLAAALGRARQAHERRPDDARLYTAFLEADVAYQRGLVKAKEQERAAEAGKGGALRRSLGRAREELARAELMLRQAAYPKPKRRAKAAEPNPSLFDARER